MSKKLGDIIYRYTLEQAIEDGLHADFGFIAKKFGLIRVVATTGFMSTVNTHQLMHMVLKTLTNIQQNKPNWIVFTPEDVKEHKEDEETTLIVPMNGLEKKVYVILDDFGSHYVLTFLLAEEY